MIHRRAVLSGVLGAGAAAAGLAPAAAQRRGYQTVYIVAIVPAGTGPVYLTGDDVSLGPWTPDAALMVEDGARRVFALEAREGSSFEYKFTQGSWDREALGPDGAPYAENFRLTVGEQEVYVHEIAGFAGAAAPAQDAGSETPSDAPPAPEDDRPRTRGRGRTVTTYIVLIVPEGTGDVYITGDDRSLGPWDAKGALMYVDGNRRIFALEAREGQSLEYKFTLGSWNREALDADGDRLTRNHYLRVGDQEVVTHVTAGFTGTP